MKYLHLLLAVAACALLAGCLPESLNPIAPPSMSAIEPRLEGAWRPVPRKGESASTEYYHFHLRWAGDGRIRSPWIDSLVIDHPAGEGEISTSKLRIVPAKIGGRTYLSYAEVKAGSASQRFTFVRYDFDWRGRLRVWPAEEQPFIDAVRAGKLRGKVTRSGRSDSVLLTDTSEHIAAFVAATGDAKLFLSDPMVFRRAQ